MGYTIRGKDNEKIIAVLESNEELRKKFYNVILSHTILQQQVITIRPPEVHTTIEYSGLYESKPSDKYKNEDFDFLLHLLWDIDYDEEER